MVGACAHRRLVAQRGFSEGGQSGLVLLELVLLAQLISTRAHEHTDAIVSVIVHVCCFDSY